MCVCVCVRCINFLTHLNTPHTRTESSQEDVQLRRRRRGLLRMYYGVDEHGNQEAENPLDIDQAGFRPDAYMEKVLKECSLNELYKQEGRMKKGGGEGGGEREKSESESGGREGCIHSCARHFW